MKKNLKLKIIIVLFLFSCPKNIFAFSIGERVNFFIDPQYDFEKREEISAFLQKASSSAYFFVDEKWWNSLGYYQQSSIILSLDALAREFDSKIYPALTSVFGQESKPGVDKDEKIFILMHPMVEKAGGYTRSGDMYLKVQYPQSNQKEIIYLNSQFADKPNIKSFLAHEFIHLITLNQKDILRKISEETWLNEARAEYAPTLLGYDDVYAGSNLENRVKQFLEKPTDSLTEWRNERYDYGAVNIFIQYLVDHYGLKILVDSLQSSEVGINSINDALKRNGFKENFSQIFADWTIAVLVNDCELGAKYCYLNPRLKNLKITPLVNFISMVGESVLSIKFVSRDWAGNWHRIVGGKGTLVLDFEGEKEGVFKIPYLVCDRQEKCFLNFLNLDSDKKGRITVSDFNSKYSSLTIIPLLQTKSSGFDGSEKRYLFSWKVFVSEQAVESNEEETKRKLLEKINYLKNEIAKIKSEIAKIASNSSQNSSFELCAIDKNLFFGMMGEPQVICLQRFLKWQGSDIYPQGIVTGNFLSLTKSAVVRFQEKYSEEILNPVGLNRGTGYVGFLTRAKINRLINLGT